MMPAIVITESDMSRLSLATRIELAERIVFADSPRIAALIRSRANAHMRGLADECAFVANV